MQFSCKNSDISNGLSIVSKAISAKSPLPILEGILIETDESGVHLTCTDMHLGIETFFPANIMKHGRVVLPGKLLSEVIRKLPDSDIYISVSDNFMATIRCEGSRTTLSGMSAVDFPELPHVASEHTVELKQSVLRDMIRQTSFAIATDETRPILTGCLLEFEGNELRLVALDGFRLALRKETFDQILPTFSAVVPGKALIELAKILLEDKESMVKLTIGKNQMLVDMDRTCVVTRLLEGEFIKYRQIIPPEYQTKVKMDRRLFDSSIDRASLLARDGKNNLIKLKLEDNTVIITSNSEMGNVFEQLSVDTEGKELEIAFNVKYISDVLRILEDDEILFKFNSNVSPCIICPTEGKKYIYLVLPVRVIK